MRVLGLGGLDHNGAAALLEHGRVALFLEAERVVRQKNVGLALPATVTALLDRLAVTSVDAVAIADQTFWREREAWLSPLLQSRFGSVPRRVFPHHDCHVHAALVGSPWSSALCVSVDGKGDGKSAGAVIADREGIRERIVDVASRHSLGRLWWGVSEYCGFPGHHSAGKIMALAAYGEPRPVFDSHVELGADGKFRIAPRHLLPDTFQRVPAIVEWLSSVFGRPAGAPDADAAASVQEVTLRVVRHLVGSAVRRTGVRRVCLSGGVALNGLVNQALVEEGDVEALFVPPCADDRGLALGAASLFSAQLGAPVACPPAEMDPFLGPAARPLAVASGWSPRNFGIAGVADRIARGQVVAWFAGGDEAGPRALGHRSILASPTFSWMQGHLNSDVKRRESFRPFGCSIMEEHASQYFQMRGPSPYMLRIARVHEGRAAEIPAVIHVDGTSRLQTVTSGDRSTLWPLLDALRSGGHPPMVLNTSLNGPGEPLAHSVADAAAIATSLRIDMLVVEGVPYVRAC